MQLELTKREKKLARELIEKGLQEEFKRGLTNFDAILQEWKTDSGDIRPHYYKIFNAVKDFDKHIARRYDNMKGSTYLNIVAGQLVDDLYDVSEVDSFDEPAKNRILMLVKWGKE
jgi:hypothetical protein